MSHSPDIELTPSELSLLGRIAFDWKTHDEIRASIMPMVALAESLLKREAIPEVRLLYFTDPERNPGGRKVTTRDIRGERNIWTRDSCSSELPSASALLHLRTETTELNHRKVQGTGVMVRPSLQSRHTGTDAEREGCGEAVRNRASLCSRRIPQASVGMRCDAERRGHTEGISQNRPPAAAPVKPNHSLNPRPATAGAVSRADAKGTIVAVPAYGTCLRGRG